VLVSFDLSLSYPRVRGEVEVFIDGSVRTAPDYCFLRSDSEKIQWVFSLLGDSHDWPRESGDWLSMFSVLERVSSYENARLSIGTTDGSLILKSVPRGSGTRGKRLLNGETLWFPRGALLAELSTIAARGALSDFVRRFGKMQVRRPGKDSVDTCGVFQQCGAREAIPIHALLPGINPSLPWSLHFEAIVQPVPPVTDQTLGERNID
jgi:hypothetical protein